MKEHVGLKQLGMLGNGRHLFMFVLSVWKSSWFNKTWWISFNKKLAYKNPLTWSSILKQWWIEVGSCLSWSRSGIWIYKMACWPSNMWDITSFHEIRCIRLSMTTGYNFVRSDLEDFFGESILSTRRWFFSLHFKRKNISSNWESLPPHIFQICWKNRPGIISHSEHVSKSTAPPKKILP